MKKLRTSFKQLIPGNPGTSFVVCLMYILNTKYEVKIANQEQFSIFTEGIVNSRRVFHSGILNVIASKFGYRINAFTNNKIVLSFANREIDKELVKFELNKLDYDSLMRLLDKFKFISLSVDIYFFYPYYHDYHFCYIGKNKSGYFLFEPKRGTLKKSSTREIGEMIKSTEENLKDAILAFCC